MKKILSLILVSFLLFGCGQSMNARTAVNDFFAKYIYMDDTVIDQLNSYVKTEGLNSKQEELYKEIIKKQYRNLEYEILHEEYVDGGAYVDVKISVYDLFKAQKEAIDYYSKHLDEFKDSEDSFINYRLEKMNKQEDKYDYEIRLYVVSEDNGYRVKQLSNDDLEKIHGIYNYEE